MEENRPSLFSHAVRSGVILGALSVVITLIIYLIDAALMVSMWMFALLLINLILVVVFGIQYRNQIGGFMTFGDGWKHGFFTLVIAGLVGTIFNILLHTVIDPTLKDYLVDVSAENAESMARSFGAPDDAIEQAMEDTRERTRDGFTISGMFMNFGIGLLIYAVIALITGVIVKKNPPEEAI